MVTNIIPTLLLPMEEEISNGISNFVTSNGNYHWTRQPSLSTGGLEIFIIFMISVEVWQLKFLY